MKKFEEIIEEWAIKYKPMQHVPGETSKNRRFFLFDSIVSTAQLTSYLPNAKSPCVAYEFHPQGNIKGGIIRPYYNIHFLVNTGTTKITRTDLSNEAANEASMHAQKFLAWLRKQQDARKELENINLDEAYYDTIGPLMNGWYSVFIRLVDIDKIKTCVDPDDYV